jgi:hypothetical protein
MRQSKESQSKESIVLLLTATIDPGATPFVERSDPQTRLRDYQEALVAWLSCGAANKIVMFENSGYDISSLKEIASRYPEHEVEFHSFLGNQSGSSKGKGYSELLGMAHVLEKSELIKNCRLVAKCTGRLTVGNAKRLFGLIETKEFDVMCTLKRNLTFANSRLFVATPAFILQYLAPQASIIDDSRGIYLEHALACATARAISDRRRWLPFPIFPHIRGVSGTSNVSETFTVRRRALHSVFHWFENYIYEREG